MIHDPGAMRIPARLISLYLHDHNNIWVSPWCAFLAARKLEHEAARLTEDCVAGFGLLGYLATYFATIAIERYFAPASILVF